MPQRPLLRVLVAFTLVGVTACEVASERDRGAEFAACQLDELKSPYPGKMELKAESRREAKTRDELKVYFDLLEKDRLEFISLCMRARGWTLNYDNFSCFPKSDDRPALSKAESRSECYILARGQP